MDTSTSHHCKLCKKRTIIRDEHGSLVCESCGTVQAFDNFQSHFTGINDSLGTFVRIGSFDNKEYKIYKSTQKIEEIASRFEFANTTTRKVKEMIEEITEGQFGDGEWFPIFIGACCYVVIRQSNLPYSLGEIASGIGCDYFELGKMFTRVVSFLDLNLPEFDIVRYYEKAISNCDSFSNNKVGKEKKDRMVKHGRLLLNCAVKWFLTTGRQPVPVVVAVLVFVSEMNGVEICIEKVARELRVGVETCRKRYKELLERLVKVAEPLPWGKNVNVKNIVKNAPILFLYMERKSKLDSVKKKDGVVEFNVEETAQECLQNDDSVYEANYGELDDSQYFNHSGSMEIGSDPDIGKISQECLSTVYTQFLSDNEFLKSVDEGGADHRKRRKKDHSFQVCNKWRIGDSDLSKKLVLKEILEKNVGFDALPPSFVAAELACKTRREKINAAKQRISKIMQPPGSVTNGKKDMRLVKCSKVTNKRKRNAKTGNVDWEDNIIEILLLHQVKEEEIEQGHYKRMLDLYVFDAENTCKIFGNGK
ncbi:hypothetical protein ACHQM5_003953 [Ranunculus cassubicifolius]